MKRILFLIFSLSFFCLKAQDATLKQIMKNYRPSQEFEEYILPLLEKNKVEKFVSVGYKPIEKNTNILKLLHKKSFKIEELKNIIFAKDGRENIFILQTNTETGYNLFHFCVFKWIKDEKIWNLQSFILNENLNIPRNSWFIYKE